MCKKGGPRCASSLSREAASKMIPRKGELKEYYEATDARHLPAARSHSTGTGSQFLDMKLLRVNDVVALAWRQRPEHLDGDDRAELIARGAPAEAFADDVRYLIVDTPGTVGITRSEGLPDSTRIKVVRTKPGVPCALAIESDAAPEVSFGTIVIGTHPEDREREIVWTAHPGVPIPPGKSTVFDDLEGQWTTLGEVRTRAGRETWLQTIPRETTQTKQRG